MSLGLFSSIAVASLWAGALPEATEANQRITVAAPSHSAYRTRIVRYRFDARNRTAATVKGATLRLYLPAMETASQRLLWVTPSHPAQLHHHRPTGNAILAVQLPSVGPRGSVAVTVTAAVGITAKPFAQANSLGQRVLTDEPFIDVSATLVKELARRLKRDTPRQTAEAVFRTIVGRIRPMPFESKDLGAVRALRDNRGDCSEMAYAFVAVARAAGVPTRFVGGWVLDRDALLEPARYHNWALFYDGATWQVADPMGRVFARKTSHYVVTHLDGIGISTALKGAHRFAVDTDALDLTMLGRGR